jgi:glycosyltransferase involved in cell wall biosynthesis
MSFTSRLWCRKICYLIYFPPLRLTEDVNILITWLSYVASVEKAALGARSGGDVHIIELSKKGNSLGHKAVLLTSNSGKRLLHAEGAKLGLRRISIPFEGFLVKRSLGVGILYILRPLGALFVKFNRRFDVIVASSHYPPDVLSALFLHLRNPKSKIVIYCHGISIPPEHGPILRVFSIIYNYFGTLLMTKFSDLIFVINRPTKDFLLHFGAKDTKIVLTCNGIDIHDTKPSVKEKSLDACFLGRLVKSKGVYDLVKVWKKVCERRNSAKLAIIGDGPEKGRTNELVVKMGLENNVTLLGPVLGDEKYRILGTSKVFVFPSYLESWGIAIAEAMACGLPVVAYNLPVYKEVFEDKLVTVPVGDVDAMAKQVIYLLENPEIARKIGEANREFVKKKYDWKTVAEKELSAISNLINKQ